ncbi:MAG: helix-turn-helix domain-containing protein [Rickettsiales bacterium]|jgi:DNA-binding transcriptional regulator YiaG|nr:helix-turn-helix domain-containing protein [Rickettsiales bacterium]
MTIPFDKLKKELLANPKVKAEYDKLAAEFELAEELIRARSRAKLSQAQVARRMGTTQSVVAKLESGRSKPSLRSLERYARAIGARISVKLVPA